MGISCTGCRKNPIGLKWTHRRTTYKFHPISKPKPPCTLAFVEASYMALILELGRCKSQTYLTKFDPAPVVEGFSEDY